MFKYISLAMVALQLTACADRQKQVKEMTIEAARTVMPNMVKTLKQQVKINGHAASVAFCNSWVGEAGRKGNKLLAEKFKKQYGLSHFSFRRTSLKPRNQANAPDAVERGILEKWLEIESAGQKASLSIAETKDGYVAMVPIKIEKKLCLGCHGGQADRTAETDKVIQSLYPKDKAVDYKLGDLRGAFTVRAAY